MTIILILAIVIGLLQAQQNIHNVRYGLSQGVPESQNLIDFVFLNK